jgi:hypothetical protein
MGVVKTGPAFDRAVDRIRRDIFSKTGRELTKKDITDIMGAALAEKNINIYVNKKRRTRNAFHMDPIFQI